MQGSKGSGSSNIGREGPAKEGVSKRVEKRCEEWRGPRTGGRREGGRHGIIEENKKGWKDGREALAMKGRGNEGGEEWLEREERKKRLEVEVGGKKERISA